MKVCSMKRVGQAIASFAVAIAAVSITGPSTLAKGNLATTPQQQLTVSATMQESVGGAIAQVPLNLDAPVVLSEESLQVTQATALGSCPERLQGSIDNIISQPTFATAQWGIVVESLADESPIYQHNDNSYFIPASNIKLLTTAAALQSIQFNNNNDLFAFHRWIHITNRDSNNSYADALLRRLGGPQQVSEVLSRINVDPGEFRQVDGSGLSRSNIAKPKAFISVLKAMTVAPGNDIFYGSLPVAGHSGTLRNRFRSTPAQGVVRAKTGTLRGVRALSGYLDYSQEERLVFSILINQSTQSGTTMLRAIDDIVLQMIRYVQCEGVGG